MKRAFPTGNALSKSSRQVDRPASPNQAKRPFGGGCWLGGGVIVLPGVSIGDGAVIGAGSVVTRDIPANVTAAGNPCRVIREINKKA